MDINFPLILISAVFIAGIVTIYFKIRQKVADNKMLYKPNSFVELCVSIFPVLLIVMVIRSFIIEPYKIPSGSMIPTLNVGDFILVNKFNYGLRLPVIGTNIYKIGLPQRGDVMVFKQPGNETINFIKRVVGLPDDLITYKNKTLYINGKKIDKNLIGSPSGTAEDISIFNEWFDDKPHFIQNNTNNPNLRAEGSWKVPKNMYFVIGDNRDNSHDSRFWKFVPDKNIVGKAFYTWMNWKGFGSMPHFHNNGIIK